MRRLFAFLFLPMLFGCAQQKVWEKPGASQSEFSQERYACLQQSQQPYSGAYVNRYGGSSNSGMTTNGGLFDACMNSRGWNLTAKTETGGTPYADALKAVSSEGQSLCEREEFQAYYRKSPCRAGEPTLEQLADRSKITADERKLLTKVRAEVTELNKKYAAIHRQFNQQTGNALAENIEQGTKAGDKIAFDLFEGRITWGEYNKRRRDVYDQFTAESKKLARAN